MKQQSILIVLIGGLLSSLALASNSGGGAARDLADDLVEHYVSNSPGLFGYARRSSKLMRDLLIFERERKIIAQQDLVKAKRSGDKTQERLDKAQKIIKMLLKSKERLGTKPKLFPVPPKHPHPKKMLLLSKEAKIDIAEIALHEAALNGDLIGIAKALEDGADIESEYLNRKLQKRQERRKFSRKRRIKHQQNPQHRKNDPSVDYCGFTAIYLAAAKGHDNCVAFLFGKGANISHSYYQNNTYLHYQERTGTYSIETDNRQRNLNIFEYAARKGYVGIIKLILDKNPGNILEKSGFSILTSAIINNRNSDEHRRIIGGNELYKPSSDEIASSQEIFRILVEAGVLLLGPSSQLVFEAVWYEDEELLKYLLEKGASLDGLEERLKKRQESFIFQNRLMNAATWNARKSRRTTVKTCRDITIKARLKQEESYFKMTHEAANPGYSEASGDYLLSVKQWMEEKYKACDLAYYEKENKKDQAESKFRSKCLRVKTLIGSFIGV